MNFQHVFYRFFNILSFVTKIKFYFSIQSRVKKSHTFVIDRKKHTQTFVCKYR